MRVTRVLMAAVLMIPLLFLGVTPAAAALVRVCDQEVDKATGQVVDVNCRWVDDGTGGGEGEGGGGGGGNPTYKGPPMMWIRFGVYSAGIGAVGEACRLWPVDEPVPLDHYRTTATECGIEGAPPPSRADVERMVHSLSASLRVPDPVISLGPEPSVNEWNMSVVGLPIWLWTETPRTASSTNSGSGMTININATLDKLTFDMGDGKQVTCSRWTPYTQANAGDPSPTCGHVYGKPSLPKGEYTITATATWTAQWSAMGYSGTLPLRSSATRSIPVGELQAVVVRSR